MKKGISKYLAIGVVVAALFGALYTENSIKDYLAYRSNDPVKIESREQAKRNLELRLDSAIPLALMSLSIYPFIKKLERKQNGR